MAAHLHTPCNALAISHMGLKLRSAPSSNNTGSITTRLTRPPSHRESRAQRFLLASFRGQTVRTSSCQKSSLLLICLHKGTWTPLPPAEQSSASCTTFASAFSVSCTLNTHQSLSEAPWLHEQLHTHECLSVTPGK